MSERGGRRLTLSFLFLKVNVQPFFDQSVFWVQLWVNRFYPFDGGAGAMLSIEVGSIGRGWCGNGRVVNWSKVPLVIGRGDVVIGVLWIKPDVSRKAAVDQLHRPNKSVGGERRLRIDTWAQLWLEKGSLDLGHVVDVLPIACSTIDPESSDHGVMSIGEGVECEKGDVGVVEEVGRVGGFLGGARGVFGGSTGCAGKRQAKRLVT